MTYGNNTNMEVQGMIKPNDIAQKLKNIREEKCELMSKLNKLNEEADMLVKEWDALHREVVHIAEDIANLNHQ